MATVKSYDPSCYELAKMFLSDQPELAKVFLSDGPDLNADELAHALALEIQQCIEDFMHFSPLHKRSVRGR